MTYPHLRSSCHLPVSLRVLHVCMVCHVTRIKYVELRMRRRTARIFRLRLGSNTAAMLFKFGFTAQYWTAVCGPLATGPGNSRTGRLGPSPNREAVAIAYAIAPIFCRTLGETLLAKTRQSVYETLPWAMLSGVAPRKRDSPACQHM